MQLLLSHINRKIKKFWCKKTSALLLSCALAFGVNAQNSANRISFVQQDAESILAQLESEKKITFNYLKDNLPKTEFTVSVDLSGNQWQETLGVLLNRQILPAGPNSFSIATKPFFSPSEPYIFEGRLLDQKSRMPIIGAVISSMDFEENATTDAVGRFELEATIKGNDYFKITYLGYEPRLVSYVDLYLKQEIFLEPKEHMLQDVVIRTSMKKETINSIVMNTEDMVLATAIDKDMLEVAQTVAGLYSSSESMQDLQIRGGTPDQVSYEWNNIRLYQNSLFYGRVGAVNPFMVDQLSITKDGASASKSTGNSGGIAYTNTLGIKQETEVRFHMNALYANLGGTLNLFNNNLQISGAFRRSMDDIISTSIYDTYFDNAFQFGRYDDVTFYLDSFDVLEFYELVPTFSFYDQNISTQLNLGENSYLKVSALQYANEFTYDVLPEWDKGYERDSLVQQTTGFSGEWQQEWNDSWSTSTIFSTSDYQYSYDYWENALERDTSYIEQMNEIYQSDLMVSAKYKTKLADFNFGVQHSRWDVAFNSFADRADRSYLLYNDSRNSHENTVFGEVEYRPDLRLRINAGLRASSYSLAQNGRNFYEPRMHMSYLLSDNFTVHMHYGEFHQNLSRRFIETPFQADNGIWLLSDEGVQLDDYIHVVQSDQFSIGTKYEKGPWTASLNLYKKESRDVWTANFDFSSAENPYQFSRLNVQGVEAEVQYTKGPWQSNMTYDFIDDKVTFQFEPTTVPSPFTQPHRLMWRNTWQKGGFAVSQQMNFATGRRFSTPQLLQREVNENQDSSFYLVFDDLFTQKVADYFRLDLSTSYQFNIGKKSLGKISFQLLNILGRENIIKNQYIVNYRPQAPNISVYSRQGLPMVWNISFDLEFR